MMASIELEAAANGTLDRTDTRDSLRYDWQTATDALRDSVLAACCGYGGHIGVDHLVGTS
ncbi:MAG: hypothetical protein Q7T45_16590 [Bradyrhizobium sp.]|uniref:hypothetical protein n=1 Tax=Bradyrhizobium sp. TaxID=376 RepID=UPI0027235229|nr:hypothetical protein [Bradyrhizobium sp.]MDO8399431.1 hypothetical protein [Bradyrhizobium sp.]